MYACVCIHLHIHISWPLTSTIFQKGEQEKYDFPIFTSGNLVPKPHKRPPWTSNFRSNSPSFTLSTQSVICRAAASTSPRSLFGTQVAGSRPDLLSHSLPLLSSSSDYSEYRSLRSTSFCHRASFTQSHPSIN